MSLSNPKLANPAKKFITFKGDTGVFQYYDKELEKPDNVEIKLPIYFVVLDELSSVSGFSEKFDSSFYSNEVHSLSEEVLKVKTFKGGFSLTGKYADIKNELVANGAKFTKSVYAMLITGSNEFELVHFSFSGAAFGAWLDKKFSTQDFGVVVKSVEEGKKGVVKFKFPKFEKSSIGKDRKDLWNVAVEMDKQLQSYLKSYKANQLEKMEIKEIVNEEIPETTSFNNQDTSDDLSF